MKKIVWVSLFFAIIFCGFAGRIYAQDSIWKQKPTLVVHGFLDLFYVYDFDQPTQGFRQSFLYNHNRHNEFNINLGYLKLSVEHTKYRANLAFHAGTYSNDNYSAEPGVLKNIFEANVGLSLTKKNNLWLDVGIFGSHIGFESAISVDNWNLTRSMLAENSPYFLTGAKLTYNPSSKWEIAALICNGWQRIQTVQGNSMPSFGTQVKFIPNERILLNWSSFIGTDDPDTTRRIRFFNNFYGLFQITPKFGLIAGFDFGIQQEFINSSGFNIWFSPVLIAQYAFTEKWKMALRAEYYQDPTGVIIRTATPNGFKTLGFSLNLDFSPIKIITCRLEGRWFQSQDPIFETKNGWTDSNIFIGASVAIKFSKTIF